MGTHERGAITKEFKQALTDAATRFDHADTDFLETVVYEEFNYSAYLDVVRQQFADNAAARAEGFSYLTGKGFEEKLITQLTSFEADFGKAEFFYTHFLDVLLYGTMYFGEKIRIDFVEKFEALRSEHGHENLHVVCHSLGTAVTHDALAKYYRVDSSPFDDTPDLKTGNFNISSLWTFANVSRLLTMLNGLTDPYSSTVTAGSEGCTNNFVNIRHKYDPFTWYKTFDRQIGAGITLETDVIKKANTHDFYEYVTNPHVARLMLEAIYNLNFSDAAFDSANTQYQQGSLGQEAEELVTKINDVKNSPSIDTLNAAISKFKEIQTLIKEASI
jgi:pimeloyl-ACP methyl ester carboxylesterase